MNKGVLLVNLGTPESPTPSDVKVYLKQFLSDKRVVDLPRWIWKPILHFIILRFRPKKSAKAYQEIWTDNGSPLMVYTKALAAKLQQPLNDTQVKVAMTYGSPSIEQALRYFKKEAITDITVLPLFPQYSTTTTEAILDQLKAHLNLLNWEPTLSIVKNYYQHPAYIKALANTVQHHWKTNGKPEKFLISFHGIPQSYVKKYHDPYPHQCEATAKLLAKQLDLADNEWSLVYQSRLGFNPWLQPYCITTLEELPKKGVTHVQVITPGFAVDCLETLEEINIRYREDFLKSGGKLFSYIPALNDSDSHAQLLAALYANNGATYVE